MPAYHRPSKHRRLARVAAKSLVALLALLLIATLALHLYGRVRFARALEDFETALGKPVVLDLASLEQPLPPPEDNAGPWLLWGAEKVDPLTRPPEIEADLTGITYKPADRWSAEEKRLAQYYLEHNRRPLEILHTAAEYPRSVFGLSHDDDSLPSPGTLHVLHASKLLALEARRAFAQGDPETGLLTLQTLSRIVEALGHEPPLIYALIEVAVAKSLDQAVLEVVQKQTPWAARPEFLHGLGALSPPFDPRLRVRDFAWAKTLWFYAIHLDDDASPDIPRLPSVWPLRFVFSHLLAAEAFETGCRVIEAAERPLGGARYAPDPNDWRVRPFEGDFADSPLLQARIFLRHLLTRNPQPPSDDPREWRGWDGVLITEAAAKLQWGAALRQMTRAALELRRLGLAEGRYPAERPEIPELMAPDPLTGRLLVYRPGDDGSLLLGFDDVKQTVLDLYVSKDARNEREYEQRRNRTLEREVFEVTLPPP